MESHVNISIESLQSLTFQNYIHISTSSPAMAATPAISSSFVILIVTLVNAHEHTHHGTHHARDQHDARHCQTPPHAQHGHTRSAATTKEWRTTDPWNDAHATFYGAPEGTLGARSSLNLRFYSLRKSFIMHREIVQGERAGTRRRTRKSTVRTRPR